MFVSDILLCLKLSFNLCSVFVVVGGGRSGDNGGDGNSGCGVLRKDLTMQPKLA